VGVVSFEVLKEKVGRDCENYTATYRRGQCSAEGDKKLKRDVDRDHSETLDHEWGGAEKKKKKPITPEKSTDHSRHVSFRRQSLMESRQQQKETW